MVKKASAWSIRIDEIPGVTRETVISWCRIHNPVLCVREETDEESPNPHYHIAMRTEEVTQETIRNRIKKVFGDSPYSRSDFATATWDNDDKLLRYFCKGPGWKEKTPGAPPDVVHTSLLAMTIEELFREFWKENTRNGERVKTAKLKTPEILDECYNHVKAMKLANWYDAVSQVTYYLTDHYGAKINDHVLFPLVQHVMWRLDPSAVRKDVADRILRKFGPRVTMTQPSQPTGIYDELISHA